MTARRTRAAVALALVLAAPGLAEAECAWVLWKQVTKYNDTLVPLKAEGAHESRARCVSAAKLLVSGARAFVEENASGWTKHYDDGMILDYRCFPDSIDPRGPKGGAR